MCDLNKIERDFEDRVLKNLNLILSRTCFSESLKQYLLELVFQEETSSDKYNETIQEIYDSELGKELIPDKEVFDDYMVELRHHHKLDFIGQRPAVLHKLVYKAERMIDILGTSAPPDDCEEDDFRFLIAIFNNHVWNDESQQLNAQKFISALALKLFDEFKDRSESKSKAAPKTVRPKVRHRSNGADHIKRNFAISYLIEVKELSKDEAINSYIDNLEHGLGDSGRNFKKEFNPFHEKRKLLNQSAKDVFAKRNAKR